MQGELQRLLDAHVPGESDPAATRDGVERLAAELAAHFEYEERTVVIALNALGPVPDID